MDEHFVVTGRYAYSNRRFSFRTASLEHALGINLWNGSVWRVINGKRKLIRRVYN